MRWLEEVISFAKSSRPPFRLGAESPRRFQRRAIKKNWGTESSWVAATRQPESGWKFDPHAQWVTGGAEASWQQLHMATLATMAHTLATSLRHRRCNWEALGARWFLADFFTVSTEQEVFFGVTFCIQSLEAFHHLGIRYFSMVILSQGPQDGLIEYISWIAELSPKRSRNFKLDLAKRVSNRWPTPCRKRPGEVQLQGDDKARFPNRNRCSLRDCWEKGVDCKVFQLFKSTGIFGPCLAMKAMYCAQPFLCCDCAQATRSENSSKWCLRMIWKKSHGRKHCALRISYQNQRKEKTTTNNIMSYSVIFSQYLETNHSSWPIMCLLNKLIMTSPNETCWMWSFCNASLATWLAYSSWNEVLPGKLTDPTLQKGNHLSSGRPDFLFSPRMRKSSPSGPHYIFRATGDLNEIPDWGIATFLPRR